MRKVEKEAVERRIYKPFNVFLILGYVAILFSYSSDLRAQNQNPRVTPAGTWYLEYLPPGYEGSTEDFPVVFFFHGLGERGNNAGDLNKVAQNGPPQHVKNGHEFPFILISPQLKTTLGNWPPNYMDEVVEYVKTELRIDLNRIYVTGLSLGGGGAWFYAQSFPEKIAALAPICGSRNTPNAACNIANENIPVWAFHGDNDGVVNVSRTVNMVTAINNCQPAIDPPTIMTIYPGVGHNSWSRAYRTDNNLHTPNLYEWMMAQSRSSITANAGPDQTLTLPENSLNLTGSGNSSNPITSYFWEKISGPNATISNGNNSTVTFSGLSAGVYQIRLTVTDNTGSAASDMVTITVVASNQSPVANAGPNREIKLPTNSLTINGSGSDQDGTVTGYSWVKISGGTATLTGAGTPNLQATNLEEGVYVFELTVEDNDGASDSDEMTLTVLEADNQSPIANAGPDIALQLPTNSTNLAGQGTDPDGTIVSYLWEKLSGPFATLTNAGSPTASASNLVAGLYVFQLTVTDNDGATDADQMNVTVSAANQSPVVSAGPNQSITLPTVSTTLNGSASDPDGSINQYEWEQLSGPLAISISNSGQASTVINGLSLAGNYVFQLTATDNDGATGTVETMVTVNAAPVNLPPVVSAGPDRNITLPVNTVVLNGTAIDPDGTIASRQWIMVSGGTATLSGQTTNNLTASNLEAGSYFFRFTATDNNGASTSDETIVNVSQVEVNEIPLVSAGPDIEITLPNNSTILEGTASDPVGEVVSYLWQQVSGPVAALEGANTPTLSLNNLAEGVRVFRLTVEDNLGADNSDQATVIVNAANASPIANAGPNLSVTLPLGFVDITGSGTDADGTVEEYLWTQIGGPGTATLENEDTPVLRASDLVPGTYTFRLTVTDDDGVTGQAQMNLTVNAVENQSPIANAGPNRTITLPTNSLNVTGTASDPDGSVASVLWTQNSGPSNATLNNVDNLTLTISDLEEGQYIFRLLVTDNEGANDFDEMRVTVNAGTFNTPPTANAGPNRNLTLPTNSTTLNGSGSDPDGFITAYNWIKVNGPTATMTNPGSPTLSLSNLGEGNYVFRLTVTDDEGATASDEASVFVQSGAVNQAPVANAGPNVVVTLPQTQVSIFGSGSDPDGSIATYLWEKLSGPDATLQNASTPTLTVQDLEEGVYSFRLTVTDNQDSDASDDMILTVNDEPINTPPVANAGPDRSITLPTNSLTINGSGSDADGTVVGFFWTKVSGTNATLNNANSPNLSVSNMEEGVYTFRLRITDDDGATGQDFMTVTVFPAAVNQPPVVNAGPDRSIKLPENSIIINGSATDPDGSVVSRQWIKVSGGPATLTNASTANLNVTGLEAGSYVFRLTATDNDGATGSDQMNLTVLSEEANQPPVANAGPDRTIQLPENTLTLNGSGTDPDGTIENYLWSKISGPPATLVNANTPNVTLENLVAGTYNFRLNITDNQGDTGRDFVVIRVLPESSPIPPAVNAGTDRVLQLPQNQAQLFGSAQSFTGTITSVIWEKISGPAPFIMENQNTINVTVSGMVKGIYRFRLTATDNNGHSGSDDVRVILLAEVENPVNPHPIVFAGEDVIIQLPLNSVTLEAEADSPSGLIVGYSWRQAFGTSNITIDSDTSRIITLTQLLAGRYLLEVSVMDDAGLTATDEVEVIVLGEDESIRPRKIFSPNFDGVDDFWIIENNDALEGCHLTMFNRHGVLVYESIGYQNNWDGVSKNGRSLPQGVYYYIIQCNNGQGKLSGSVTIIR